MWYSHKINGTVLSYELGLFIHSSYVIWANGPWPASVPDLNIFRSALKKELNIVDEFAVADDGYPDLRCIQAPVDGHYLHDTLSKLHAMHGNFNGRLKIFRVLSVPFRHCRSRHATYFYAVLNITKVMVDLEPLRNTS